MSSDRSAPGARAPDTSAADGADGWGSTTATGAMFSSVEPATGRVVARVPHHGPAEVDAAVARARHDARVWAARSFRQRRRDLRALAGALIHRADELAALLNAETGKPHEDSLYEVLLGAEQLDWSARNAARVLGERRVSSGLVRVEQRASVAYRPLGVVAVIGPWNYPVLVPMGAIASALAAGNAVVHKPSEHTPAVGRWLGQLAGEVIGLRHLLAVVTGFGDTGDALCRAEVDKVSFTGSVATARKVAAACAETLTPLVLETGGNDAMIVLDDADVDDAARQAVWGRMQNAGQVCVAIERAYATPGVHDELLARIAHHAAALRRPGGPGEPYGPITLPSQLEVIREHLDDALDRGARAIVGGRESVRPPYVDPVVLADVPEGARVLSEETFGPLLPVVRVADAAEALERANATGHGLGAAVFGRRGAATVARHLRAGMVSIDGVVGFGGIPALPWGGMGASGYGRVQGDDGLRAFAHPQAMTRPRVRLPVPLTSFDRPPWVVPALHRVMRVGRRPRGRG